MDNSTFFLLLVIFFGLIISILVILKNGFSGLKLMFLGLSIILCGGVIALSPDNTNSVGIIICIGLILSFIGLWKKD